MKKSYIITFIKPFLQMIRFQGLMILMLISKENAYQYILILVKEMYINVTIYYHKIIGV